MVRRQAHHRLPCGRGVARLNVVVDQPRVTRRGVKAFPQVLEKDRYEHRADRQSNDGQTDCCLRWVGYCGYVTSE